MRHLKNFNNHKVNEEIFNKIKNFFGFNKKTEIITAQDIEPGLKSSDGNWWDGKSEPSSPNQKNILVFLLTKEFPKKDVMNILKGWNNDAGWVSLETIAILINTNIDKYSRTTGPEYRKEIDSMESSDLLQNIKDNLENHGCRYKVNYLTGSSNLQSEYYGDFYMLGGEDTREISYEDLIDYRLTKITTSPNIQNTASGNNVNNIKGGGWVKPINVINQQTGGTPNLGNQTIKTVSGDKIDNLDIFLLKLDVTTNKLNSDKLFVFYRNVIKSKFLDKFEKEVEPLTRHLMLLRNATNSRDEKRIKEALLKIKSVLLIDDNGVTTWVSENNIELYLSKSTPRKIGNLHEELVNIMRDFNVVI